MTSSAPSVLVSITASGAAPSGRTAGRGWRPPGHASIAACTSSTAVAVGVGFAWRRRACRRGGQEHLDRRRAGRPCRCRPFTPPSCSSTQRVGEQPGAHRRVRSDRRHRARDLGAANRRTRRGRRDARSVVELDHGPLGHRGDRIGIAAHTCAERRKSDRPVHRAGVEGVEASSAARRSDPEPAGPSSDHLPSSNVR
jgi:hypothetical protein